MLVTIIYICIRRIIMLINPVDELSPESGDDHIKDLANRVRKIAERQGDVEAEASHTEHIDHELKKVLSTDEQEETEK